MHSSDKYRYRDYRSATAMRAFYKRGLLSQTVDLISKELFVKTNGLFEVVGTLRFSFIAGGFSYGSCATFLRLTEYNEDTFPTYVGSISREWRVVYEKS